MTRSFLVAALALAGCAGSVQTVDPAEPTALRALAERSVDVHLVDGRVRPARGLRVAADTTSWVDRETGALVRVATADVAEVRRRDRAGWSRRVAGRAALATGLAGLVLGAAAAATVDDDRLSPAAAAIGTASVAVMYGTAGGALGGAVAAPQDRYVLAPDSLATRD